MIVTYETTCPDTHPEVVFTRPWYGLDIGCDCIGVFQKDTIKDLKDQENMIKPSVKCTVNQTDAGCRTVEANHAVHMAQLNGRRICGATTETNFMTMVRPDL